MGRIEEFVAGILESHPELFTFDNIEGGFVDIRDFQTTGVVAFAKGRPFTRLTTGYHDIGGHRTQVNPEYQRNCCDAAQPMVDRL